MFSCERCGSRYSAAYAVAIESCPRCQARDGITVPLTFNLFQRRASESSQRPTARRAPAAATRATMAEEGDRGRMAVLAGR